MLKRFIPTFYSKSIFDVPLDFYKKNNIKIVFTDLDNTLDSYKVMSPSQRVIELFNIYKENGIDLVIISNNTKDRIHDYANALNSKYLSGSKKPFKGKINKFIKQNQFIKDEIFLIGDQLVTDVQAGINLKIKVMLTEPIVKEDQPFTRFNRMLDRIIRKKLRKKGILKEREVKGNE